MSNLWEEILNRWAWRHSPPASSPTAPAWAGTDLFPNSHAVNTEDATDPGRHTEAPPETVVDEREYAEDHRAEAREAIRTFGTEAIAFYAPIHWFGCERWGIYFHERVFFGMCAEVAFSLPNAPWDDIVVDMLNMVERHEFFHAGVELYSLVLEDFAFLRDFQLQQWIHEQLNRVSDPVNPPDVGCPFQRYFEGDYLPSLPSDNCLEESLATACQFRSRFRTRGFRAVLAKILEDAPPSYRKWTKYRSFAAIEHGIQVLAERILAGTFPAPWFLLESSPRTLWFPEVGPSTLDNKGPVPRWLYRSHAHRPLRFAPAVFGNLRLRDLLSGLRRRYDARIISGGKHRAIVFPNGKKVPFPSRKTVSPYLVADVANALGVERNEILSSCFAVHV